MPREHGDDGAFVETIGLDDVREVFNTVPGPVILSADVADGLDCSRETARRKLKELHERGDLERRKVSRRVIYWEPEEEDAGGGTDTARGEPTPSPEETPGDTGAPTHADESGLIEDVRTYLEATDTGPKTEHGRDAVIDVLEHLREHGTAKTSELKDMLESEYVEHYKGRKAMWESLYRYLEDIPGIVTDAGHGTYGYAGDETVRDQLNGEESGIYDPTKEF